MKLIEAEWLAVATGNLQTKPTNGDCFSLHILVAYYIACRVGVVHVENESSYIATLSEYKGGVYCKVKLNIFPKTAQPLPSLLR
jgi:hypothetical protein